MNSFNLTAWTWSQPQTLLGFILYALIISVQAYVKKKRYNEAYVVYLPIKDGGMSLGPYIFLSEDNVMLRDIRHEYGHTIQSYYLGPLYLLVISVPSMCLKLASLYNSHVKEHYFEYWPESWANTLGEVEDI